MVAALQLDGELERKHREVVELSPEPARVGIRKGLALQLDPEAVHDLEGDEDPEVVARGRVTQVEVSVQLAALDVLRFDGYVPDVALGTVWRRLVADLELRVATAAETVGSAGDSAVPSGSQIEARFV